MGGNGGDSLKVPQVSAPSARMGMGQEGVPVPLPSPSKSSHRSNHQFDFASVAENQPQNKHIESKDNK